MHLGSQGLVLDQLEIIVLENDVAGCGRHIATDLESTFVGDRQMALLYIRPELLEALGQAFALGLQSQALRLRVQRQEVARRSCINELLHGKADALTRLVLAFDLVGHLLQGLGIEQIKLRHESAGRIGTPGRIGKTPVCQRLGRLGIADMQR